jgi:hypothetical protein
MKVFIERGYISAIVSNNPAIGSTDQVWIGAKGNTGDLKFFWSDGSPFVFQNWQTGDNFFRNLGLRVFK